MDINAQRAESVAEDIRSHGRKSIGLACDVSKEEQAKVTMEKAIKELGKIDILAAVAGIGDRAMAEYMTMAQWDRVININLRGLWLFDQGVGQHLISRNAKGSIINMAPIARQVGIKTGNANYAASKELLSAFYRSLSIYCAEFSDLSKLRIRN